MKGKFITENCAERGPYIFLETWLLAVFKPYQLEKNLSCKTFFSALRPNCLNYSSLDRCSRRRPVGCSRSRILSPCTCCVAAECHWFLDGQGCSGTRNSPPAKNINITHSNIHSVLDMLSATEKHREAKKMGLWRGSILNRVGRKGLIKKRHLGKDLTSVRERAG